MRPPANMVWSKFVQNFTLPFNYFTMFLKDVSNVHRGCIYLINKTVKTNIVQKILKF